MPKNGLNVALKGADEIFSTEESRQAEQRGKTASCSVNMPQAVIQFSFTDAGASDITIQQANEAEAPDTPA